MASIVDICNSSLLRIGDDPILSLDDDSVRARTVKDLYPKVRDAVLRAHPWNCALARTSLALLEAAPSWGFNCQYTLPTNPYCLRVLKTNSTKDWKVEGRNLLTDEGSIRILYIKRIEDPTELDALLSECIITRLSAELAVLTGKTSMAEIQWKLYINKLSEARSIDAIEGTPEEFENKEFLDVR